jgi:DNA primase
MAKLAPTSTKYIVKASIKAKGIVEKPDVIGAVFGQTEGLLGADLDLRELQRTGRIGRIEVNLNTVDGNSEGEIIIPSSLDAAETALIAATLETIERVGPCNAEIKLIAVEDTRSDKRKFVVDKAKEILKTLSEAGVPNADEVSEQIKAAVRTDEITNYQGSPCGPNLLESENIIIVEGRADVVNLLKYGIKNTIAIEGTSVPPAVADLTRVKSATVFVDGDRGGELIIKELMIKGDIDFVTAAPRGKEVEELSQKEVFKALRDKVPVETYKKEGFSGSKIDNGEAPATAAEISGDTSGVAPAETERPHSHRRYDDRPPRRDRYERRGRSERHERSGRGERRGEHREGSGLFKKMGFGRHGEEKSEPVRITPKQREEYAAMLDELVGTRAACIVDEKGTVLGRVPATEIDGTLKSIENASAVVFDGKITASLAYAAKARGVKCLVGSEKDVSSVGGIILLDKKDFERK